MKASDPIVHIADAQQAQVDLEALRRRADGGLSREEVEVQAGRIGGVLHAFMVERAKAEEPIPMLLWCPLCSARHVDAGDFASKPHHTHACQSCGMTWRPAIVCTVGVQFLPGFKDAEETG